MRYQVPVDITISPAYKTQGTSGKWNRMLVRQEDQGTFIYDTLVVVWLYKKDNINSYGNMGSVVLHSTES